MPRIILKKIILFYFQFIPLKLYFLLFYALKLFIYFLLLTLHTLKYIDIKLTINFM